MGFDGRRIIKQIRAVIALGWLNGAVAAKRNPLWVISNIVPPLTFLILIKLYARPDMLEFALIGGLIMTLSSNAIGLMGDTVFYKREVKLQDMVVASPMGPLSYMFGLVFSGILFSIPGFLLFVLLMVHYNMLNAYNSLPLMLASVLTLISLSGLAFTLATFVKEPRFVWPLSGILSFIISVLPPVYYPASILPDYIAKLSMLIPTSSSAAIFHLYTSIESRAPLPLLVIWLILIIESIIFLQIAMKRSQWREK